MTDEADQVRNFPAIIRFYRFFSSSMNIDNSSSDNVG
jgi:hypothetical protein